MKNVLVVLLVILIGVLTLEIVTFVDLMELKIALPSTENIKKK